jgi:hypothetical protein
MTQAPKRIVLSPHDAMLTGTKYGHPELDLPCVGDPAVEYHHADLSADLVRAALERAMTSLRISGDMGGYAVLRDLINDDKAVAEIVASVMGEK